MLDGRQIVPALLVVLVAGLIRVLIVEHRPVGNDVVELPLDHLPALQVARLEIEPHNVFRRRGGGDGQKHPNQRNHDVLLADQKPRLQVVKLVHADVVVERPRLGNQPIVVRHGRRVLAPVEEIDLHQVEFALEQLAMFP